MANQGTPVKAYRRGSLLSDKSCCRTCGEMKSHLQKIYSLTGKNKDLEFKIKRTCGIDVSENETITTSICRNCETFLEKMHNFRRRCQRTQLELRSKFVFKRAIKNSPCQTSKRTKSSGSAIKSLNFEINKHTQHDNPEKLSGKPNVTIKFNESWDIFVNQICTDIEKQASKLCSRKEHSSILLQKGYTEMANFNFDKVFSELNDNFPILVNLFNSITKSSAIDNLLKIKYSFIYSILMSTRWHELSLLQRINTVLIIEGGCSKKLQQRFNRLGVCQSHGRRDPLLNVLGGHFMDKAIASVKSGNTLRGTGDNWDMRIMRDHMRKDIQNVDMHLFASNIIGNRISLSHLNNDTPLGNIKSFDRMKFSLSMNELKDFAETTKILWFRIIQEFLPQFQIFKSIYPKHVPHRFSEQMATKSLICNLPIIDANEAKYQDCVKILRHYEKWIGEIYFKAGKLTEEPVVDINNLSDTCAVQPGQPYSQVIFSSEDKMKEMKIVFAGDQLTRVRFSGAKDLLRGAHTPSDRFEHCSPFKPVMWHTKASFLQYCFHFLYSPSSEAEIGTLKYFREKFNRKNATPKRVLDSFQGSEELFISVGKSYIVAAAMHFFGIEDFNGKPQINPFPVNIIHADNETRMHYVDKVMTAFVDKYFFQKDSHKENNDYVYNYGYCIIFLTTILLHLKDTAAEGDGDRNLVNQKLLLSIFKSLGAYSKYAIEMFTSIAQIECTLTERLSEEYKWGFFVNWRGGAGNNIEDDLSQEISNQISKKIVQRMGANKSVKSISKICKASNGIKEVMENFDDTANITASSSKHSTRSSSDDEKEMIKDILKLNPFNYKPRHHKSFPNIKRSPLKYLDIVEFHKWLDSHLQEWVTDKFEKLIT